MFKDFLLNEKLRVFFELILFAASHIAIYRYFSGHFSFTADIYILAVSVFYSFIVLLLGQDIGAHRFFSHNSFQTNSFVKTLMLILISIANYGSALDWKVSHLTHHKYSDTDLDPTNPKKLGFFNIMSNVWKLLSLYNTDDKVRQFQKRTLLLTKEKDVVFFHLYHMPIILCFILTLVFAFPEKGFVYFFAIPSLYSSYVLNLISYLNHKIGAQGADNSKATNFLFINLFLPGAGWHANHHADPGNYRFNKKHDLGGFVIEKFLKREAV